MAKVENGPTQIKSKKIHAHTFYFNWNSFKSLKFAHSHEQITLHSMQTNTDKYMHARFEEHH